MRTHGEILLHKLQFYWTAKLVGAENMTGLWAGVSIEALPTAAPCYTWFKLPQTQAVRGWKTGRSSINKG